MSLSNKTVERARLLVHRVGFDVSRAQFKHRFVYALNQHNIDTVLDIGANIGQFGRLLRQSGFTGRIHSVEPLESAFASLRANAANDLRWSTQRAAVSDAAGEVTMYVSANSVSSSVLPILQRSVAAAPQTAYIATERVPATTVDDIVADHGLATEHALLKMDLQGLEKIALAGAVSTLTSVAAVRTEMSLVALYDGQVLMPEIVELLGGAGFDLWQIESGFVEPDTRRLLQLDGVFFRRPGA